MLFATNRRPAGEQRPHHSLFAEPFHELSANALLEYFQTRTTVHYFPVPDLVETARPKIDDILCNQFEFNGERHAFSTPIPWLDNPSQDREWLILLHKFYYAVGLGIAYHDTRIEAYAAKWVELTSSWIETVPHDFLPSDVAGRRIQNWIFAHYYFITMHRSESITPGFYVSFLKSLHDQVCYLLNHLTPGRNHRTIELCAIFLAAVVFPEFEEASAWRELACRELLANIQTDILPDGVHCELSTDYHHLVLKNYLWVRRLAFINHIALPPEIDQRIQSALKFALYAHRPDGMIPSLSDGDSRCFLHLLAQGYELYGGEDLLYVATKGKQGQPPAKRSVPFRNGGYYILRSGWGDHGEPYEDERYLIFDCGPLGEGHHGHLDLLSFEAAAYGKPLVVDPGRYTYDQSGPINWRAVFRGTSSHNTVLIDGANQTKYVRRKQRYKIEGPAPEHELIAFVTTPGLDFIHGIAKSHEYSVVHERKICFVSPEYWIVTDLLLADAPHTYELLFHLSSIAQDNVAVESRDQTLVVRTPHMILAQPSDATTQVSVSQGFVSQTYGCKYPAPVIQYKRIGQKACFHTVLFPYRIEKPTLSVNSLRVQKGDRLCEADEASAISLTVTMGDRTFYDSYYIRHVYGPGAYQFGEFHCDSAVCFIRRDESGTIIREHRVM